VSVRQREGRRYRAPNGDHPREAIAGASKILAKNYPGVFSQVVDGLDAILQMPYGCFEQTTSITCSNVLVLDYLRRTKQTAPETEMKATKYIALGYQRLLSFEVLYGGFSLFGKPPMDLLLTAYGLMELNEMARVFDVDPIVIERTQD